MSPGHDFFYEGGGRREAVEALFEGIHRPGAVVVLAGEAGSGRTAVIERFCSEVDPDVLALAVVTGDILMSAGQCLSALADALALAVPSSGYADDNSPGNLVGLVREGGRTPVLVVDDAHELGEQPRAEVIAFCHGHGVPLVLAGDRTLSGGAVAASMLIELRAFTEDESEDFVAAWLAVDAEDELPSHRTIEKLHRQAGGMPGRLAALLEGGAAARNTWFPAGFPLWHVVFTVGAAVILLLLLTWFVPDAPVEKPVAGEIAVPLPAPRAAVPGPAAAPPETRLSSVAVPRPLQVEPFPPATAGQAAAGAPSTPVTGAASGAAPVTTPIALPPPVQQPSPPAPAATTAPGPAPGKQVAVRRYTADEDALLKERASRYTLQLFASFNEQAVRQFRSKHAKLDIRVFRTLREDLPWYVAVTGSYRNKDEAKVAVARLPADIQHLKPWARSVQGIQDELRRRKD